MKSFIISIALIIINVYVNWFVLFHLTWHPLLDTSVMRVTTFRIVIAACQVSGSLLCLLIVDFVERKVNSSVQMNGICLLVQFSIFQYILLTSIFGITLAQIIYIVFEMNSRDETTIPILFIALTAFCLHFGVYPLTFVLLPEIIPEKVRKGRFFKQEFIMVYFCCCRFEYMELLLYRA